MREKIEYIIHEMELEELENFFKIAILPAGSIKLNSSSTITDISHFIKSHLDIVKAQRGNLRYKPYLDRLIELKQIINLNTNKNGHKS